MVSSSSEQVAMKGNSPETARKIAPSANSNANPKPNPDPDWGGGNFPRGQFSGHLNIDTKWWTKTCLK